MIVLQVLALLFLIGAILLAVGGASTRSAAILTTGVITSIFMFFVFAFTLSFVQIEAGNVGVVKRFGAIQPGTLGPGLHSVFPPFINDVDTVDTKVHQVRIEGYGAASLEQQNLFLTITLNYHVDPNQAQNIIQNIGTDYEAKIVTPRFLDIPKTVTDDYPTTTVLGKREEIRQKATDLLRETLEPFGIVVDGLVIENFDYSPEYNAAIEAKQVAQQAVETEKQKREQAKIAAETAVETAKGQANAQIERARGEAEANRLIAASLTETILMNRYIEKLAPGIQSILVPSDNGFILDLGSLLAQGQP